MNTTRVRPGEIAVGRALPWSAYDANGRLLLQAGYVIRSAHQLDALIARGLYRRHDTHEPPGEQSLAPPDCPFDLIGDLQEHMVRTLTNLQHPHADAAQAVLHTARKVQAVCGLDANACLGAVHLSRDSSDPAGDLVHQAILCEVLMRHLDWDDRHRLSVVAAALTSNLATLDLQRTLREQAAPLTVEQLATVRRHPAAGREMLERAGADDPVWLDAVLHHHERLDGSGYPFGLSGTAICMEARVVALTDIYLAMISPRAYRQEMLAKEALREIFLQRGRLVDEDMSLTFIKELGVFPPGAFVMLENGEIGVVIQRGRDAICPMVSSLISPRGGPYARPLRRTCDKEHYVIREMVARDPSVPINPRLIWGYD
ncbi:MAG: HD domain-containing phosphohydrolase [Gammaproteobacteria bacterium]